MGNGTLEFEHFLLPSDLPLHFLKQYSLAYLIKIISVEEIDVARDAPYPSAVSADGCGLFAGEPFRRHTHPPVWTGPVVVTLLDASLSAHGPIPSEANCIVSVLGLANFLPTNLSEHLDVAS